MNLHVCLAGDHVRLVLEDGWFYTGFTRAGTVLKQFDRESQCNAFKDHAHES